MDRKGAYITRCPRCGMDFLHCRVPNCGRVHRALGLCWTHYRRLKVYGDVLADIPIEAHGNAFPVTKKKTA